MSTGPQQPYTAGDDAYIRRHALRLTAREMACMLGRSEPSIRARILRLGGPVPAPTSLQIAIALTAFDGGFSVREIHSALFLDVCAFRTLETAIHTRTVRS